MLSDAKNWKEHKKLLIYVVIGCFLLVIIAISLYFIIMSLATRNNKMTSHDILPCKLNSTYFSPLELNSELNNISITISGILNFVNKQTVALGTFLTSVSSTTQATAYYDPKTQFLIIDEPVGLTNPTILVPPKIDPVNGSAVTLQASVCINSTVPCATKDIITYTYKGTIWPNEVYDQAKTFGTFSYKTFAVAGDNTTLVLVATDVCHIK